MRERPILFSGPMVKALLSGTKTQTRHLITTRHPLTHIGPGGSQDDPSTWGWFFDGPDQHGYMVLGRGHNDPHDHGLVSIPCPYGEPGDRLWVRETWFLYDSHTHNPWPDLPSRRGPDDGLAFYREGFDRSPPHRWRPSIFMPRWASRITLEVTDVRVQRLQQISEDDAKAEGVEPAPSQDIITVHIDENCHVFGSNERHRASYAMLWNEINGKRRRFELIQLGERGYPGRRSVINESAAWAANPWVWAVTFRVMP